MDALLIALLACLLGEMGDRSQMLCATLAERFRRDSVIIAGMVMAVAANAALSAFAGNLIAHLLAPNARNLFLALGFLAGGVSMLMPTKAPDALENWRIGAFGTSTLGLFILGFGESAQFLIAGISAAWADPVFAGIGGALGIITACTVAIILRSTLATLLPLRLIRRGAAIVFLLTGGIAAVRALGLT
jgi:putative Ca2+/H+ antiporter (TMEM165/GDT1 family)